MRTISICVVATLLFLSCSGEPGPSLAPEDSRGETAGSLDVPARADLPTDTLLPCGGCPPLTVCGDAGKCVPPPCSTSKDCPGSLVCAADLGICVACTGPEDCDEGLFCGADHACHETYECSSDKDCKDYDMLCDKAAGACVECLGAAACEADEVCVEGFCLVPACAMGATKCVDDMVMSCPDGMGWVPEDTCTPDLQYCEEGACVNFACPPGKVWCEGETYKVCAADGKSIQYEEDCAASNKHCFGGACHDTVCPPNEVFCEDGDTAATCAADGMDYTTTDCPGQHYCAADTGKCQPWVCEPGSQICQASTALTCDVIGSAYASEIDCAVLDKTCEEGQCVACTPQCAGKDCGDDGCDGSCGNCGDDENCVDGICMPEQLDCDGDGTPECPDLPGHKVYCNGQNHCEYADSDPTGWKKWNVWIWVPPGAFLMGSPEGEYQWNVKEVPVHMVTVANGYWIGKFEVTVAQYQACMADVPDGCTPPLLPPEDWDGEGWGVNSSANGRSEHPQNTVTWEQAGNVCAWIAPSGRLPSEAEWEYAASGPVHRKYPWGDAPQPYCYLELAVFDDDGNGRPWGCVDCVAEGCSGTSPVGTMPKGASYVGALDMAGNVSEWCQDNWHDNYDGAPSDGSAWLGTSKHRVFRGGRFSNGPDDQRCAYRNHYTVASATTVVQGVRCAFSAQ